MNAHSLEPAHTEGPAPVAAYRAEQWQEAVAAMEVALTAAELSETFLQVSERVFGASGSAVYIMDDTGPLRLMGSRGGADLSDHAQVLPLDAPSPLADTVRTGEPLWFESHDVFAARYPHLAARPTAVSPLQAMAVLPLISNDRRVGALSLVFGTPRSFTHEEKDWLGKFAVQYARAAERARRYAAEQRARTQAETLLRVAHSINRAPLDLETVVQKVTDESTALVGAQFGAFFYNVSNTDGEAYQLFTVSGAPRAAFHRFGLSGNTPLFPPTFASGGIVRLDDVTKDPRYDTVRPPHGLPKEHLAVTSYLVAPVISRDGSVLGGLFFGHPEMARFTEQHETLVEGLAAIAAGAIDNALLFRAARDAEEKQRRLAEGMAETVRLNDLLTGVLAHDLRNPLAGVITGARLVSTRTKDEQLTKPLARVMASAERMTRMVDQLLDVARVRLGQTMPLAPAAADLLPLVRHVVDELQDARRGSVSIEHTGDTTGVWDADRLGQLFSNLIGNALQHGGGDVRLQIDGQAPGAVAFRIHNAGAIPASRIPTLFDPFSAADRPRGRADGLGLGLFIAQEIAKAHGARLEVLSDDAAGTTFSMVLPRAPVEQARPSTRTRALADAQERAWQSEQRMRLLVDGIRDYGIFMLDLHGRVTTWNTGAQRVKGYTANEIIGQHLSIFYTAPDRENGKPEALLALAATRGSVEDLGWRVRKDGSTFWANVIITALRDSGGELCGFAKVTRDLSERRDQEERLQRSEEQFRLMVESVTDYAIFKLDPKGIVNTWNSGAKRIKGYRADEIIGQHFSRFYEPEEVRSGKCEHELQVAAREGRFEDEGWRVKKDGSRFWASVVITALRAASGVLLGYTKVTRDLTERRRLEDERRRRLRAEEAIHLRDDFLSMISHELRTPLTGLQLQLQSLVRRLEVSDDKVAVRLRRAAASGERLEALIELLLDVTRIAGVGFELSTETVDLAAVVGNVVDRFRESAAKAHSPVTLRCEGSVMGRWDRTRIEQMVASLLSNALKYGAGAPISLTLTGEREDVLLEIRDHGPGIAAQDLEGLFERFGRRGSIRHHGGLGLGLYLVREIARAHGGQAEVHNARDGGAYFVVRLPREPKALPAGEDSARELQ